MRTTQHNRLSECDAMEPERGSLKSIAKAPALELATRGSLTFWYHPSCICDTFKRDCKCCHVQCIVYCALCSSETTAQQSYTHTHAGQHFNTAHTYYTLHMRWCVYMTTSDLLKVIQRESCTLLPENVYHDDVVLIRDFLRAQCA